MTPIHALALALLACGGSGTATVADDGPQGTFTGPLTKGSELVKNHEVVVMTNGAGEPQIGLWEFCNIQLTGSGPYTAADGASCMVDLGDGKKPHAVKAKASFASNAWSVEATFDDGTVWSWKGSR